MRTAARITFVAAMLLNIAIAAPLNTTPLPNTPLVLGIEQPKLYLPLLADKKVGVVVNQTSQIKGQHLVDLLRSQSVDVQVIFAPEHGFRGQQGAGESVVNSHDLNTGILIQSIYGANKTPPDALMQSLDVIVFDIQDVGTRFYTYISSMHYMMAAAAKHKLRFVVLDRPNPNGAFTDGPILEPAFQSFVGMHPIPILHGLTVGELAQMIKGQAWIELADTLDLHIIPMQHYHKSMPYSLPYMPSPNLPNAQAIKLYPSLCLFEGTAMSVGRGTDFPFQVLGHSNVHLADFAFTPRSKPYAAPTPKLQDIPLKGIDLRSSSIQGFNLSLLIEAYHAFAVKGEVFFTAPEFFNKLSGTAQLQKDIKEGLNEAQIRQTWQHDLDAYKRMRADYLLYPQQPVTLLQN